jgi:hypothetical protein
MIFFMTGLTPWFGQNHLVDDFSVAHRKSVDVANILIGRPIHFLALQRAEAKDDGTVGRLNLVEPLECLPGVFLAAFLESDKFLRCGEAMTAHEDRVEAWAQHGLRGIEVTRFHLAKELQN